MVLVNGFLEKTVCVWHMNGTDIYLLMAKNLELVIYYNFGAFGAVYYIFGAEGDFFSQF